MDVFACLSNRGFHRVIAVDGPSCGVEAQTLLMAFWLYEAEKDVPLEGGWIHPYYPASQRAYRAAQQAVQVMQQAGLPAQLRDDVRVKPIFARLPGFSQGRNTLSYMEGVGSRFHVQVITIDLPLPLTHTLEERPHNLHCGTCRACMDACPTHAIDDEGFHRERCLRQWMLPGKVVPENIRAGMGNRFLGCDECQRVCPYNPPPMGESQSTVSLEELLTAPKTAASALNELIGANLAIPNRVLSQGCMVAGCSCNTEYLPALTALVEHPSAVVQEHASWARQQIEKNLQEP